MMLFLETVKEVYPDLKNIFEVGAHRGDDIYEILRMWPDSTVYAFEADPFNFEICRDKFKDNENVRVYHLAVTDKSEKLIFNRYYDLETIPDSETMIGKNLQNTGQGSLMKPGVGMKDIFQVKQVFQEIEVEGICLEDFCNQNCIGSVDAILMDVQGAEMNVFNGCGHFIDSLKATIFEWSTKYVMYDEETDFVWIKSFLESRGLKETKREYQFQGISGDSLFLRKQ
jgi:FkbM family methyltransferase